jgi:hypothetical protein
VEQSIIAFKKHGWERRVVGKWGRGISESHAPAKSTHYVIVAIFLSTCLTIVANICVTASSIGKIMNFLKRPTLI